MQIKFHFVPIANEKPQVIWHNLKLHPYGPDAEKDKDAPVISQNYEEILFNEPFEPFYEWMTGGAERQQRGKGKSIKQGKGKSAEIPDAPTKGNPYSRETESLEVEKLKASLAKVDAKTAENLRYMRALEDRLANLRERADARDVSKKK